MSKLNNPTNMEYNDASQKWFDNFVADFVKGYQNKKNSKL